MDSAPRTNGPPSPCQTRRSLSSGDAPNSGMGPFHEVALHQLHGLLHRALAADDRVQGRLSHAAPAIRIGEELSDAGLELAPVRHEHGALRVEQELGAFAKIAGVSAEANGL